MKLQQFALDIKLTRHDLGQLVTRTSHDLGQLVKRILSFYGIPILIAAVTQLWHWHHNPD